MSGARLRSQALNNPTVVTLSRISEPIVQTIFTSLPKLNHLRLNAIAAPMRWARHTVTEFCAELVEALFQFGAVLDRLALIGSPGAELAAERARVKVFVRLGLRNLFDYAFNPHLSPERRPIE